ncbi:hypothetical protein D7W82_09880 [Corallococcus sp. CA049B]|nr:hypothetical protein D7W82_09880 [Corallococcus sp. CA049B]
MSAAVRDMGETRRRAPRLEARRWRRTGGGILARIVRGGPTVWNLLRLSIDEAPQEPAVVTEGVSRSGVQGGNLPPTGGGVLFDPDEDDP